MKKCTTTPKYKKNSNVNRIKRGESSAPSFLQGNKKALNQHHGYGNGGNLNIHGGHGNSGKPVKNKVSSGASSSRIGSTQLQNQINWDGGTHTETGWSEVLEPCACHDEPTDTWGGSNNANRKSGKSSYTGLWGSGGKCDGLDCLCLVAAGIPTGISLYFPGGTLPGGSRILMPTYFPTYYPAPYLTSFPTDQ